MPSGVRDIQLLELKDTISQLNNTISTQNELIRSLQKMLQERDAKDSEKDQLIANLQAQLDYLKTRLFGSTSEIRHEQLPGQLDLFHLQTEDEPEPSSLAMRQSSDAPVGANSFALSRHNRGSSCNPASAGD